MGSSLSSKQKWVEMTRGSLEFSVCDNQITLCDGKKTAAWQIDQSHVHGKCYSNRTVKTNERVALTAYGNGFLDIGLTEIHPMQMVNKPDMFFKIIVTRVLYFEPYTFTFWITPNGDVMMTEGDESKARHVLELGAKAKTHWLVVKMGCGDLSVTISAPAEPKQNISNGNQISIARVANQHLNASATRQKLNRPTTNQKSNSMEAKQKTTATISTQTLVVKIENEKPAATIASQKSITTVATQTPTTPASTKKTTATVATQKSFPVTSTQKSTATQTSIETVVKQAARENIPLTK